MNEHVFVGVVSVDETVTVSDVEPFNTSGNTVGDYGLFDTLGDGDSGWGISRGLFDGMESVKNKICRSQKENEEGVVNLMCV